MELAAIPVCFDDPTGAFSPARPPAFRFPPGLPRPAPVPAATPFVGTFPISPAGTMIHRVADGLDDRRVPRETEPGKRAVLFSRSRRLHVGPVRRDGWLKLMLELTTTEGPTSRKASLQRYLEKRKDRYGLLPTESILLVS
ncbi:hypothetical protein B296_00033384 [Ensete ventricosum]|uniref:Uncharacterized protein n=1 Tax=Ensete ventricosum TaxID=4639 RepID=A0A426ZKI6_ENSVE|nr:hypothetical protein B296_00033384 [Ensete ventricosum]